MIYNEKLQALVSNDRIMQHCTRATENAGLTYYVIGILGENKTRSGAQREIHFHTKS